MASVGEDIVVGPCECCCGTQACDQSPTGQMAAEVFVSPHGADIVFGTGFPYTWPDGVETEVLWNGTNCFWEDNPFPFPTRVAFWYDGTAGKWSVEFIYSLGFTGGHITFYLDDFDPCGTDQILTVTEAPGTVGLWTYPSELRVRDCGCGVSPAPMAAAMPLKLVRPDRCISLLKRTEFRSGCGGMNCRHGCKLGLPAVPGVYCQTCPAYVADDGEPWIG